jgi:hypothetical protein
MSEKSDRALMVRAGIASGLTDAELAVEIGIWIAEVADLRAKIMKEEVDRFTGSTEETFALYMIFTDEKIGELDELARRLRAPGAIKQGTAAVGAIRAQHDLYEKAIKKGQELGLIKAASDGKSHELLGLEEKELAAEIQRRLESIQRLRAHHQGVPLSEVTITPPGKTKKKSSKPMPVTEKRARPGISKISRKASLPRS